MNPYRILFLSVVLLSGLLCFQISQAKEIKHKNTKSDSDCFTITERSDNGESFDYMLIEDLCGSREFMVRIYGLDEEILIEDRIIGSVYRFDKKPSYAVVRVTFSSGDKDKDFVKALR